MGQDKRLKQPGPQWRFKGGTEEKPEEGPFLDDLYLYAVKFEDKKATISDAATWFVAGEDSRTYVPPRDPSVRKLAGYKFVPAGEATFYVSVEPLTNGCAVLEHLTKDQCATAKVSRSYKATVDLEFKPDHFPRLPLGHAFQRLLPDKKKTDGTLIPTLTSRWHKVYIPTKYGGYLSVKGLKKGRVKLFHKEFPKAVGNRKRLEEEKGLGVREIAAGDDTDLKIEPKKHGWYYLKVEGVQEAYELEIRFCEEGHARLKEDADAQPHIPLGFYYWPYGYGVDKKIDSTHLGTFEKYDKLTGRSGDRSSLEWEKDYHKVHGAKGWAGHCHNASTASIYVKLPEVPPEAFGNDLKKAFAISFDEEIEPLKQIRKIKFSRAEVQLLATEWAGRYKEPGAKWQLSEDDWIKFDVGKDVSLKKVRLLYSLRPAGPHTKQDLLNAIGTRANPTNDIGLSSFSRRGIAEKIAQEREERRALEADITHWENRVIRHTEQFYPDPKKQPNEPKDWPRPLRFATNSHRDALNRLYDFDKVSESTQEWRSLIEAVETALDKLVSDQGGPAGFSKYVEQRFGREAARLHAFLQQQLGEKGEALESNLRDANVPATKKDSPNSPTPVWNHAVFLYRGWLVEHEGGDPQRVKVTMRLVANADHETAIGVSAVTEKGGRLYAIPQVHRSAVRELDYVIRFNPAGEVHVEDKENAWTGVRNPFHPVKEFQLYAPSNFIAYTKPRAKAGFQGSPTRDGNHEVDGNVIGTLVDLVEKYV